jgi:riboflavin kinase / FMN adenylyltransferase
MRIFRHHQEVPVEARGAVIALGNFDGVHRGHQAVIDEAARIARQFGTAPAVLTFEPHPREFFQPDMPIFRLTPFRLKMRQLEAIGIDHVVVLHFDKTLAAMSAEAFVVEILGEGIEASHVVCGYDFVFGRGRTGNATLMRELGREYGFGVTSVDAAQSEDGIAFSSTRVREHLLAGEPAAATRLLGRPWEIVGRVEHGARLGRALDFPTANISMVEYLQPKWGVYAVRAGVDEGIHTYWRDGVASIGIRPTVNGTQVLLETYLFDFSGDLYHRNFRVALIEFLRPEVKFGDISMLKRQMTQDAEKARSALAAYEGPPPGAVPPPLHLPEDRFIRPGPYERALKPRPHSPG